MRAGILYTVRSDLLPKPTIYQFVYENSIDNDGKFFSSPEFAHEAYGKWKEKTKNS